MLTLGDVAVIPVVGRAPSISTLMLAGWLLVTATGLARPRAPVLVVLVVGGSARLPTLTARPTAEVTALSRPIYRRREDDPPAGWVGKV